MNPPITLDKEDLDEIYSWVDTFQLSRAKRNIAWDFSDGFLIAEIVQSRFPRLIDFRMMVEGLSKTVKEGNWHTLNRNLFLIRQGIREDGLQVSELGYSGHCGTETAGDRESPTNLEGEDGNVP